MRDKLSNFYGITDCLSNKNKFYTLKMSLKMWITQNLDTKVRRYTFDMNPRVLHNYNLKNAVSKKMSSNFQNRCFEDEKCK